MRSRRQERDSYDVRLRCLIIDDNPEFLRSASTLLEGQDVEIAGIGSSSDEAVQRMRELQPDVALVDIKLGDENGFDLVPLLTDCPVVLISTYAARDFADLIAESPALGFLSKSRLFGGRDPTVDG
jgi:DNA-binding NarL/FixJ family response regulator